MAACVDFTGLVIPTPEVPESPDIGSMVGQVETLHLPHDPSNRRLPDAPNTRRVRARLSNREDDDETPAPVAAPIATRSHTDRPQMIHGHAMNSNSAPWLALISMQAHELGKVIHLRRLRDSSPGGITSVKMSPSGDYVALGYGVRDRQPR